MCDFSASEVAKFFVMVSYAYVGYQSLLIYTVLNSSFTPKLKQNVRAARMRYHLHLEERRKLGVESENAAKSKLSKKKSVKLKTKEKSYQIA